MMSLALIKERVGGKHALSLRIFLLSSPFWILGFTLNERASFYSFEGLITVFLIACVGQIVMGLTLWIGFLLSRLRHRTTPLPLTFLLVVWAASALTRIIVITQSFIFLGLPDYVPLANRITVSVLMATVAYALGSYGLDAYDRFRDERARLLTTLLAGEEQLATHRAAVETMKRTLLNQVDSELRQSRDSSTQSLNDLELALTNRSDVKPALEELRSLSDETWNKVRSVLGPTSPALLPKISARELITLFAASGPFRLPLLATLSIFLYLLVYSRAFDPLTGAVATIGWLGAAVIVALGFNWLLGKAQRFTLALFGLASLSFITSSIPVLHVAAIMGVTTDMSISVISVHGISLLVMLASSIPPTVALARRNVLDNLRRHMDSALLEKLHVESQLAIIAQKIASQLHGDVRGNFLASVLNLQRNIDNGHVTEALETISKLRATLAEPVELASPETNSAQQLETFVDNWSAILDIEFDNPISSIPQEFMPAFHTVVVDAVNNAVRHGNADWIRVGFSIEPDAIDVNIRNNGHSRATARVGLGTVHLNQLAPDKWSRFSNEQGITQLVVRLERQNLTAVTTSS
jgi:signal transduction histidine kinase